MNKQIKLFLITGASGIGKSTLIPLLRGQFSSIYRVYDFDEILEPYDFTKEWETRVAKHVIEVSERNAEDGYSTIVVGLIHPQIIKKFVSQRTPEIKFCLLTITADERSRRLKERGAGQELIGDIEELIKMEGWLRESGYPFIKIDTTNLSSKDVASSIVLWIRE